MKFPFYTGNPINRPTDGPAQLPVSRREGLEDPRGYLADPGLVDAANVALLLGQPLLLTGEPGSGKTQFASSLAYELGFEPPLKFETKSASISRDLFYSFDTVGRFHAAQTGAGSTDPLDYISYHAFGIAILRASRREDVARWLPKGMDIGEPRRSVVLIDEIDKAPRDFPNDLLNEVEGMYFRVPELGPEAVIRADPALRPLLVITSNSEKHLPDAFLRRCVYYDIPFPKSQDLCKIIAARVGRAVEEDGAFLNDVISFFEKLRRDDSGLNKKPATAELLGWILALQEAGQGAANPLREKPETVRATLSVLVKTAQDQKPARDLWEEWHREAGERK